MTEPNPAADWWTTSDVAAYLGVRVATVSSYRGRGQMPAPARTFGRTHLWRPKAIIDWHASRKRPGIGGTPRGEGAGAKSAVWHVLTAVPSREDGVRLAREVVAAKLAAGAQVIGPATSVFWHLGQLGEGEEWSLRLVTLADHFDALADAVRSRHPWDNPEVVATPVVGCSPDYLAWVRRTVAA